MPHRIKRRHIRLLIPFPEIRPGQFPGLESIHHGYRDHAGPILVFPRRHYLGQIRPRGRSAQGREFEPLAFARADFVVLDVVGDGEAVSTVESVGDPGARFGA